MAFLQQRGQNHHADGPAHAPLLLLSAFVQPFLSGFACVDSDAVPFFGARLSGHTSRKIGLPI